MKSIKKQIVTDESFQPVAVIIDYHDWQKIEKILERLEGDNDIQEDTDTSEILMSYAGSLTLSVDPLEYQRKTRDEWL